ncbi:MAG TPA: DUF5615 family PIN-like protein [Kiritimatiellia bacterium]|nr:DUF5615 family PIN-like protein [Kiritimatiellia bacterium]
MNFLVDAQLPQSLCEVFRADGHDAIHTLGLPEGNRTSDEEIRRISEREHRVVITKDADFYYSFVLYGLPWKLLLGRIGNMGAAELIQLFRLHLKTIVHELENGGLVEMDRQRVVNRSR